MQAAFIYDRTPHFVHSAYKFTGKERDTESGNDDFGAQLLCKQHGTVPVARLVSQNHACAVCETGQPPESQSLFGGEKSSEQAAL